jgi:hypothetical protein
MKRKRNCGWTIDLEIELIEIGCDHDMMIRDLIPHHAIGLCHVSVGFE